MFSAFQPIYIISNIDISQGFDTLINYCQPWDSRKNKFAILSVEAPGWQGAKVQEYQAYSELSQRSQPECIGA